jgi:hypothetical protein
MRRRESERSAEVCARQRCTGRRVVELTKPKTPAAQECGQLLAAIELTSACSCLEWPLRIACAAS